MAKMTRKARSINKFLSLISAVLAIVAVVMIFLPQIHESNFDMNLNGLKIAFGSNELKIGSLKIDILFSMLNLLAYVFVVAGLLISALQLAGFFKGKLMSLIAALALIAGGVMFFFAINFSSYAYGLGGNKATYKFTESIIYSFELAYGAIVGGITAILSGLCMLGRTALSK